MRCQAEWPKVLHNKTYEFLKSIDGYFVEITITKVGINKKFPLMSYITDTGIRLWTNDMVANWSTCILPFENRH